MKRFISVLLLVLLALSMAMPALAGGCDYHDTFGDHDWYQESFSYPTCTSDGYYVLKCRECGYSKKEINGSAYGHSWELISETDPTCTEKGRASYYCIECGESRTETTKALGHKYKVQEVIQEATCISSGSEKVKCSRCNKVTTRETDTTDHKYGEWELSVPATDCTKGQRTRMCNYCGKEQSEEYYPEGTLYRGISDKEAVKVLQTRLTECGYLNDSIDGIFGKKTEKAVADFQNKAAVTADGIAWPQTNQLLEKEWQILKGIYVEESEARDVVVSCCTSIENENGAVEFVYCAYHQNLMEAVNALLEPANTDQPQTDALLNVRLIYQEELNRLNAEWLNGSLIEDQAGVIGAQGMFVAYLNAQELVWSKQYGENSVEALTKVNEMLHDKWVELCGFVVPAAAE